LAAGIDRQRTNRLAQWGSWVFTAFFSLSDGGDTNIADRSNIFASVTGDADALGTLADPVDVNTAIQYVTASGLITPLPGTYPQLDEIIKTEAQIIGQAGQQIILEGGEVNAGLIHGSGFKVQNVIIRSLPTTRVTSESGSNPATFKTPPTFYSTGHLKIINCIAYGAIGGAGSWFGGQPVGQNGEIYGLTTWGTGWIAPDGAHGSGVAYTHQAGNGGYRTIQHCMSWDAIISTLKYASAGGANVKKYHVIENLLVEGGLFGGANTETGVISDFDILDCIIWNTDGLTFGARDALSSGDLVIEDNTILSRNVIARPTIVFNRLSTLSFQRNIVNLGAGLQFADIDLDDPGVVIDFNDYYYPNQANWFELGDRAFVVDGVEYTSVAAYQTAMAAHGQELNSTFTAVSGFSADVPLVPDPVTAVWQNQYLAEACFVVAYNPSEAATVTVDLSSTDLVSGKTYRVINARNPLAQTFDILYGGTTMELSTALTAAAYVGTTDNPYGYVLPDMAHAPQLCGYIIALPGAFCGI